MRDDNDDDVDLLPTFPHRQTSEGEINYRRHIRHRRPTPDRIHRSVSSPDFQKSPRHQPVQEMKSESITMMQTRVTVMTGEIVKQQVSSCAMT